MDKFVKQTYEEFTITADFSNNMAVGETITSQTVTVLDAGGDDASIIVVDQASVANDGSTKVSALVRGGGVDLSPYKITFKIVTSVAHKWELDVQMLVKAV